MFLCNFNPLFCNPVTAKAPNHQSFLPATATLKRDIVVEIINGFRHAAALGRLWLLALGRRLA